MPKNAAHGRIVWHELAPTDSAGAKSFYPKITQWTTAPWEDAKNYDLWTLGEEAIGGVTQMTPDMQAGGAIPHWLPFVCVYDVDATVRQTELLGGRVRSAPKEVTHVGCWAVISDPFDAPIGVFEPADKPPGHDGEPKIGEFSWHELATDDYEAAAEFYRALFRWDKTSEFDMGEGGIYHMFGRAGQVSGGIYKRPPEMPVSAWLSYIRVDSVKPVADMVQQLGGTVANGPMEVPGGDWVAQCADPQGAAFALHAK